MNTKVSYSQLTDAVAKKADKSHNHSINDVNGLIDELKIKAKQSDLELLEDKVDTKVNVSDLTYIETEYQILSIWNKY